MINYGFQIKLLGTKQIFMTVTFKQNIFLYEGGGNNDPLNTVPRFNIIPTRIKCLKIIVQFKKFDQNIQRN